MSEQPTLEPWVRAPTPRQYPISGPESNGPEPTEAESRLPPPICALGAEVPPPPEFLASRLLLAQELHLLLSDGGTGKTTTGLAVGGAYANGTPLFDHEAFGVSGEGGDVLIVSAEDGLGVQLNRLEALIRGHGWDRDKVLARTHLFAQAGVSLDEARWLQHLKETAEGLMRPLIIFDPLSELTLAKENSNDEAKPLVRFFRHLATEAEATPLILHHSGKASEGQRKMDRAARGASAWYSAARGVYFLSLCELGVSVECLKMNRAAKPSKFVLRREIESDPRNPASWARARLTYLDEDVADEMEAEGFIVDLLKRHPDSTSTAIRDAAKAADDGPSQFAVAEAIRTLEAVGRIAFNPGPRNSKLWYLTDPAEASGQGTLPTLPDPAGQGAKGSSDDPADPSLEGAGSGSHSVDAGQGDAGQGEFLK